MCSHKPGGQRPLLSARPAITFQSQSIIAVWPVPNYTAWWQRHVCVNNSPKVVTCQWTAESEAHDLSTANPMPLMPRLQLLRFDYDTTTTYRARLLPIRRKQKMNMSIFRRSRNCRIVVESQLWYRLNRYTTKSDSLTTCSCLAPVNRTCRLYRILIWQQIC